MKPPLPGAGSRFQSLCFQCFGWLGLNGAGKSTTFKMLTGELSPTGGGFELKSGTHMGYCPQENSLDGMLTVRETLRAYCLIRGVKAGPATGEVGM